MGRKERRAIERAQRKQNQPKKPTLNFTYDEFKTVQEANGYEVGLAVSGRACKLWLTAFGLYLREYEHYGRKRMNRAFSYIDETVGKLESGEMSMDEIQQRLKDEVDIEIEVER